MVNYAMTYTPKDGRGYNSRQRHGACGCLGAVMERADREPSAVAYPA